MQYQKPSIPNPCLENWDKMKPNHQGRFCHSCEKTVVDFTQMSDLEILEYLKNSKSRVCGRFNQNQIEQNNNINLSTKEKLIQLYHRAQSIRTKPVRFMAVLTIGLTLILTGCKIRNPHTGTTTGAIRLDSANSGFIQTEQLIVDTSNPERGTLKGEVASPSVDELKHKMGKPKIKKHRKQ